MNPFDPEMENEEMSKKPVHEIRLGRIKAAIWENETENGSRHNVTITRLYKDDDDNWRDSGSFGREDLPLVVKVADMAHTWIFTQKQEETSNSKENGSKKGGSRKNGSKEQNSEEEVHF
jgi:hypothetical protein